MQPTPHTEAKNFLIQQTYPNGVSETALAEAAAVELLANLFVDMVLREIGEDK